MVDNTEYDDSAAFRDAQTAHEVRFLIRGLRQLAPDPHAEVPADFHATVMTRARVLPLPRPRLWDQTRERLTVWAPALAVALVLSLGVHVWQGLRGLGPQPLVGPRVVGPAPIYQFQAQLLPTTALGALVTARPVPHLPRARVGFTSLPPRSTFVRMGLLYTDTLAVLQSGAVEAAKDRLDLLTQAVNSLQAPPALAQYLGEMQSMLQRQPPTDHTMAQLVALFEPLYAQVYATDPTAAAWVLFQTGAWAENLSLAAAAGAQEAVQQAPMVQALHDALRPLNVPDAVLDALQQLHDSVAHQPVTAQDLRTIQTLADTITHHLSE